MKTDQISEIRVPMEDGTQMQAARISADKI